MNELTGKFFKRSGKGSKIIQDSIDNPQTSQRVTRPPELVERAESFAKHIQATIEADKTAHEVSDMTRQFF